MQRIKIKRKLIWAPIFAASMPRILDLSLGNEKEF
jgi:hypothetical protein